MLPEIVPDHVPDYLVHNLNYITDPDILSRPWEFYDSLNELPGIFYSPELGGHWVVTRHDLIVDLLRRHDLFSTRKQGIPPVHESMVLLPSSLDPPDHAPFRKLIMQSVFAPRRLASFEADMRTISRAATAAFVDDGHCEFMSAYARPVPVDLFMRMMGLPPSAREEFLPHALRVVRGESAEERALGYESLYRLLSDWIDEFLSEAPDNQDSQMLAVLTTATLGEDRELSRDELLSMVMLLVLGGMDTVTSSMSHIMHFMATSPAHRQLLVGKPELIPDAVEELLRRFGISNMSRVVTSDTIFHGVSMKAGDMVLYSTSAASLDNRQFEDPKSVDFERTNKKSHLAFGSGVHFCAGHHLARTELRIMLEDLLPQMPNLRLEDGAPLRYVSGSALSLDELRLVWG